MLKADLDPSLHMSNYRRLEEFDNDDEYHHEKKSGDLWHPLYTYPYYALVGRQGHSMTNYRLKDDQGMWREFLIFTGGFSDWGGETIFPVWAYDLHPHDDTSWFVSRWIDLSGKLYGSNYYNQNSHLGPNPPPAGTWPEGRIGHLSHVTTDGVLHVWGGTKFESHPEDPNLHLQCEEVPYVWRTVLPRDVLLRTNVTNDFLPHDELFLTWERIIPHVILDGAPSPPPFNNQCVSAKDANSTADENLPQFWNLNQEQWNVTAGSSSSQRIRLMQRLRRSHARGGLWRRRRHCANAAYSHATSCHADARTASNSFVMYGGLYRLSVDTQNAREDPTLTNPNPEPNVVHNYQVLGDVWSYDFDSCTFSLLSSRDHDDVTEQNIPPARTQHAATIFNKDQLIVHGGWTSKESTKGGGKYAVALADMWKFDLRREQWMELKTTFSGAHQRDHTMVALTSQPHATSSHGRDNALVIFGGCLREALHEEIRPEMQLTCKHVSSEMYLFPMSFKTVEGNVWFSLGNETSPSPPPRTKHSATVDSSGRMYLWGGDPELHADQFDTTVWKLNAPSNFKDVLHQIHSSSVPDNSLGQLSTWILEFAVAACAFGVFVWTMNTFFRALRRQQTTNQPAMGLTVEEIQCLPLREYQGKPTPSENSTNSYENDEQSDENCCPICLVEYAIGDSLRCLPCKHDFHQACVDSWFTNHKTCPSCRHLVLQDTSGHNRGITRSAPESVSSRGVLSRGSLQQRLQLAQLLVGGDSPLSTQQALTEEVAQFSFNGGDSSPTIPITQQLSNRRAAGRQGRSMTARLRTSLRYMGRSQQEWDTATSFSSDLSLRASVNEETVDDDAGGSLDEMERFQNVTEMVTLA